jgi:hypothetical protein
MKTMKKMIVLLSGSMFQASLRAFLWNASFYLMGRSMKA